MLGARKMSSILIHLVFVILTTLIASLYASADNATSVHSSGQVPRASSRAVKLHHHHSRSSQFQFKCHSEGFYADQSDCTVFHRCIDAGKGKYAAYRFQCGPGTVYDPENDICNHPANTRRTECGGFNRPSQNENEIDEWDKRPNSTSTAPQLTSTTYSTTKITTSATGAPTTTRRTTTTTIKPNHSISPQWTVSPGSNKCSSDGFMGDSNDCRKFYRCVDSGRGTFIRYEFACSQSTVWDEELQVCNHAWAVKNKKCGSQSISLLTEPSNLISNAKNRSNPTNSGIKQPQSQQNLHNHYDPGNTQSQPQINYGWRVNQTQNQINYETQSSQIRTQINHGTVIRESQIQSNYGKDTTQIKSQKKHSDHASQKQTQFNTKSAVTQSSLNDKPTTSTKSPQGKESSESDVCTSSGFMGDSKDCKKFYRCVDNGKGYTRYEFSCGEGTVWDQEIEACNHAWAVKTCGGKGKPQGKDDDKISTTKKMDTSTPSRSTEVTSESPKIEPTTARPLPESTTKGTSTSDRNICTGEGFVGDPDDCKKFYRCVSNGRDGFLKYEFACGQGTVWDSEIESCNHDWAVKRCGGSQAGQMPIASETSTHSSTGANESGNFNSGSTIQITSQSATQILREETTKQTTSQQSSHKNKCSREGFVGDTDDCKIFYRCVDNGKGGYMQYEYSCGQGTVWDPEIESCNHAWAVPKCGGDKAEQEKVTKEKHSSTSGYNDENTQSTQSHSTTESKEVSESQTSAPTPSKGKSSCTEEGFFEDTDDCKKFYRCVDNGKGGLTKYEFTCGEGTAWDPEVEGCNHEGSVKNCGKTDNNSQSASSLDSESPSQEKTTTEKSAVDEETNKGNKDCDKEENKDETSKPPPDSNDKCSSEGFFGYKNDCKKFYRCVDNGKGGFTKYEFNCGEGTVWDPEIQSCNHAEAVKNCGSSTEQTDKTGIESNPTISTTSATDKSTEEIIGTSTTKSTTSSNEGTGKCSSEGFFPDPHDCKKFYRCVDNGKGGYTKYDFSCGEGTLWDPEIDGCNHEDAVKNCVKSHEQSSDQSAVTTSFSTESTSATEEKDNDKEAENENGSTSKPSSDNTKCSSEGFFGVQNDCKKFYRCVDNGKGGFTKYDFNCGEGTAWDQEIESCNHKDAVKNCGGGSKDETDSSSNSTNESDNVSSSTTSTTTTQSNEGTPTSTSKTPNKGNSKCSAEGFYSDPEDCKKFFRCVDNGKGGYTKYDFTCGEGTLWDQEIQGCNHESAVKCSGESHQQESNIDKDNEQTSASTTSEASTTTTASSSGSKTESSSGSKDEKCSSEGFYANKKNCKKFYRCVDNGKGGYTRYDFECGEGTLWDEEIQACNHENAVKCSNKQEHSSSETSSTENSTTSTQEGSKEDCKTEKTSESPQESQGSKSSESNNTCENEGFFGDSNDCKKFYRCVDNGKGGLTKYDFTCGEGTIWDQEITACNHEWAVEKRSCNGSSGTQTQSTTQASQQTTSSQSSSSESTQNQESHTTQSQENIDNAESTTKEPCDKNETKSENNTISCPHAGFFPDPSDCKKFYRCVDWDGNGEKYSVFHFDCGEGTIWDPKLDTCNYEESVYPPRDCSKQSSGTTSKHEESSTTEQTTHDETSTESQITTTKKSMTATTTTTTTTERTTTESETSEGTTTESSTTKSTESTAPQEITTTTEGKTSESSTTEELSTSEGTPTTTEQSQSESTTSDSSIMESTTSESTTSESTTSEPSTSESTTSESTTSESTSSESTTSESTTSGSTTPESTTSESATSDSTTSESATSESTTSETTTTDSTTSESTTSESTTSESTTSESTTSESTTSESNTSESTTPESTTSEPTTTDSTTEPTQSTTEQQTTETTEASTTDSTTESGTNSSTSESTTESSTDLSSRKDCPETEEGQYLYICPTGFKRHPKYCNLFYQCTNSPNDHDVKVAVFHCPNNTIYDEEENQCLSEDDTEQKCEGQIAEEESRRLRQLNDNSSPPKSLQTDCPREGHFSFEKENKCSHLFLKCQRSLSNTRIQGFVHQCPEGYIYWTISRRCERAAAVNGCSKVSRFRRWEIPLETLNVAV